MYWQVRFLHYFFYLRDNNKEYYEKEGDRMNGILIKVLKGVVSIGAITLPAVNTLIHNKELKEQIKKAAENAVAEAMKNK